MKKGVPNRSWFTFNPAIWIKHGLKLGCNTNTQVRNIIYSPTCLQNVFHYFTIYMAKMAKHHCLSKYISIYQWFGKYLRIYHFLDIRVFHGTWVSWIWVFGKNSLQIYWKIFLWNLSLWNSSSIKNSSFPNSSTQKVVDF